MSRAKELLKNLPTTSKNEEVDVMKIIKDLIDTNFSGSNEEQGKAAQLFKGLAFSDDPRSNKFMKAIDDFTSSLDPKDFDSE